MSTFHLKNNVKLVTYYWVGKLDWKGDHAALNGLSLMRRSTFFLQFSRLSLPATLSKVRASVGAAYRQIPSNALLNASSIFSFTSFNRRAHFQPNFTAIWIIWLFPLRDHTGLPSSWGWLRKVLGGKKMRREREMRVNEAVINKDVFKLAKMNEHVR